MPNYTRQQKKAIFYQGRDILVSASAGSGKTTVLVERVLQEILKGTSVDQLLIVTFTKAAAEEMKKRIKDRLAAEARNNKNNRHYLHQQLNKIDQANISTIDAFCLDVIHRFYYAIDLDPSFSVLTDETQRALLKERALKEIENENLTAEKKSFREFYNNFAGDRDAQAPRNILLDLYDYAMTKPDYEQWLKGLPKLYEVKEEIVTSIFWQKQIKPYLFKTFTELRGNIDQLLNQPAMQTKEMLKVKQAFSQFAQNLQRFIAALKSDQPYSDLRELLRTCRFTTSFRKSKKWDEDLLAFYQNVQNLKKEAKNQVFVAFTAFFASDEQEQLKAMKKGKIICQGIVTAEEELIRHFNALKRADNLIDFADMEQLAYQILSQDTSNSALARDFYQEKFKEILVDEYQDINPLQEKILQLLKKMGQNNIFMVGDVKQSIYGFRQAEPSLFLQKYHAFGQKKQADKERILLAANFRSTKPVTKLVNHLFNPVLSSDFGGIDYRKEGQLVFGADYYPDSLPQASEIIFHEKKNAADMQNGEDINFSEISMVIQRIKQFAKEKMQVYDSQTRHLRPLRYSDIAILTRSRSNNLTIMQEFAKAGIPLFVTDAENYFQTFELTVVMNYLKIIDNPDQDIPLVTVLRSPLFNFDEKDLARIRIKHQRGSFYNALRSYASYNTNLGKKIRHFLNLLADFRNFAVDHRISELIWSIYQKTSLLEIMTAMPNGQQRRINLESLYERASSYESAGFKGLYQFINFINRMRESQKDLAQPLLTKEAGDAVRLMTIHGAKGLEFPIVFYVGLEHRYQMRDLNSNYIINKNSLGLTISEKHYRLDTLVKAMGNIQKKRQILEEEARILYVALTRAKQKLILVADIPNISKKEASWRSEWNGKEQLSLGAKLNANSPLSFIGPSLNLSRQLTQKVSAISGPVDEHQNIIFVKFTDKDITKEKTQEAPTSNAQEYEAILKHAKQLFSFHYPFTDASQAAAYQSVSEIKQSFANEDPDERDLENAHLISSSNRYIQPINTQPDFLFQNKFTGADIGTATHLILQYYDYQGSGSKKQLQDEITQLIAEGKLSADIVKEVDLGSIEWFVHSDFSQPFWQHPQNLKREVSFSSLIKASRIYGPAFSDPHAKILVHGTIDGYYQANRQITLFDYKTDFVDQSNLKQAEAKIAQKYQPQLALYEDALNQFEKGVVVTKKLVLLNAKTFVDLPLSKKD